MRVRHVTRKAIFKRTQQSLLQLPTDQSQHDLQMTTNFLERQIPKHQLNREKTRQQRELYTRHYLLTYVKPHSEAYLHMSTCIKIRVIWNIFGGQIRTWKHVKMRGSRGLVYR